MKFSVFLLISLAVTANAYWMHENSGNFLFVKNEETLFVSLVSKIEYAVENENTTYIDALLINLPADFTDTQFGFPETFTTEVDVRGVRYDNSWRQLGANDYYPVSAADIWYMVNGEL